MTKKETDIIIETNNMQIELTDCVTFWDSIAGLPSTNNALVEYINTVISIKQDLIYYIVSTEADKDLIPNKRTGIIAFVKSSRNLYLYFSEGTTQEWLVLVNNMSYYYTKAEVDNLLNTKVTKNTSITGATKCKITYDSKGLVTDGTNLSASDIPDLSSTYYLASNPSGYITSYAIVGKENISNKVTSISPLSTNTQYPSAKCVYDIVGDIEATLQAIRGV